jgi:hypothetical protein
LKVEEYPGATPREAARLQQLKELGRLFPVLVHAEAETKIEYGTDGWEWHDDAGLLSVTYAGGYVIQKDVYSVDEAPGELRGYAGALERTAGKLRHLAEHIEEGAKRE